MFRCLSLLLWLATGLPGLAAQDADAWWGTVSRISDGDTVWVRPATGGAPRKLRLHGIDAPELCQAHGRVARAALAPLLRQRVRVQPLHQDDHGRLLARLWWEGEDLGAQLVREGHAWSYRYRRDPGPYAAEERAARAAGRGLFADGQAQRPYAFRRQHGPCH